MAQNIQVALLTTTEQVVSQDIFLKSVGYHGTGFAAGTGAYTSAFSNENVFRFEASGKTSADGHPTYYLKHVASGKYFEDYVLSINEVSSYAGRIDDDFTGLTADKAQAMELVVCPFQIENAESTRDYATPGWKNENDLSFEGFVFTRAELIPRKGGETSVQFLGHFSKPFYSIYQDTNVWHIYGAGNLEKFNNVEKGKQTFHFKVDGVEYGSKTVNISSYLDIPTMSFLNSEDINCTSDGYDIICTEKELPFIAQSTFDANTAHWYALNINGASGNYLLSNKGGSIVSTTTVSLYNHPDVLEDAYLWAFVGNLKDGYRIYSKVDHKSLALYNQLILKKGNGSLFKLYEKSDKSNFGLYVDEGKLLTRESENKIVASTEDNNNDRSTFRAQKSKLYVTNYAKPFFTMLNNTEAPENAIWGISYMNNPTNRANYRALFLAANAKDATHEQIAALGAENVKIANAGGYDNTIEEGKYYRLYNAGNSKRWLNVSFNAENTSTMRCDLNAEKSVTSVVNFVRLSNGCYDMKVEGLSMSMEDVEISAVGNRFKFRKDHYYYPSSGYLDCEEETASFNYYNSGDNNTAQWFVVPATEAEIAMSEVNGKSYASAYLPFPVNGISGAEAYVGKLNDAKDMLNMTQVQGVAENTGFVLVGNADKATLSIGETTESATSDLKGSNTNIVISSPTVDLHDQYLVFGVNDGSVGFYTPSFWIENIPANKAYLEANQLASKAIAMNFGDNTTSIGNATVVANENAPIYDLSGRRVAKTVKGGVYIQNGKKFVK